jgi:hypothetical protein
LRVCDPVCGSPQLDDLGGLAVQVIRRRPRRAAGKQVTDGSATRCFAQHLQNDALMATGLFFSGRREMAKNMSSVP